MYHALEIFREYNFRRNHLQLNLVPKIKIQNLANIVYHYLVIFRKFLRSNDSNIYDNKIKSLISANMQQILNSP